MAQNTRIEELERKGDILARLAQISTVLNSTLKLKPLLSTLMDTAAEIVDAEGASVLLWDAKNNELRFVATTTGESGQALIGRLVPLEGSIAGTVMRENRIVALTNVEQDPRHYSKVDEETEFTTRSILGVPMRSKNRVIGVLEAVNKRSTQWTEDDGDYLSILAAQAAVAIEGAQLVAALQKANDELSQLDKLKSDFIAIASHELRTPLGVILGYASFLQDTSDPEVKNHANKVVASALQLRRIIEDLTNLRYLEQHQSELNRETILLDDFVRDGVQEVAQLAEAKGHRLTYTPPAAPVRITIDRSRMGMAFTNVLNNAVRFTPDYGQIKIETEIRSKREVWITVTDNGVGIAKDQIERIFERFVQVEDHMTRTNGGLGIGLSIAQALIEAHDGRIWANSPGVNQGSTFTIALPITN
jgi:signal transduction histidine kinase